MVDGYVWGLFWVMSQGKASKQLVCVQHVICHGALLHDMVHYNHLSLCGWWSWHCIELVWGPLFALERFPGPVQSYLVFWLFSCEMHMMCVKFNTGLPLLACFWTWLTKERFGIRWQDSQRWGICRHSLQPKLGQACWVKFLWLNALHAFSNLRNSSALPGELLSGRRSSTHVSPGQTLTNIIGEGKKVG